MVPDQDADRRETLLHSAYDAATVRALERPLLDDGVPLMRMAAGAVAEIAARLLDDEGIDLSEARVVVLAGAGTTAATACTRPPVWPRPVPP